MNESTIKIYTVTTIQTFEDPKQPKRKRCVGFFYDINDAKQAVLENWLDIAEEGRYNYAVIEDFQQGLYSIGEEKNQLWFEWNNESYIPIEKPARFRRVVNFGIG